MAKGWSAPLGEGAGWVRGRGDDGPESATSEVVHRTVRGRRAGTAAGNQAQDERDEAREEGVQAADASRPGTRPGPGCPEWRAGERRGHEGSRKEEERRHAHCARSDYETQAGSRRRVRFSGGLGVTVGRAGWWECGAGSRSGPDGRRDSFLRQAQGRLSTDRGMTDPRAEGGCSARLRGCSLRRANVFTLLGRCVQFSAKCVQFSANVFTLAGYVFSLAKDLLRAGRR